MDSLENESTYRLFVPTLQPYVHLPHDIFIMCSAGLSHCNNWASVRTIVRQLRSPTLQKTPSNTSCSRDPVQNLLNVATIKLQSVFLCCKPILVCFTVVIASTIY